MIGTRLWILRGDGFLIINLAPLTDAFLIGAVVLAVLAFVGIFSSPAHSAPVTWDFVATSCSPFAPASSCDPKQAYPVVLATLTLPGPDSSGTAFFNSEPGPPIVVPAVYTGDSFALNFSSHYRVLTPAFTQNPTPFGECDGPGELCQLDISWSESAGQLNALHIYVNTFSDTLTALLSSAKVASDNIYYGADGKPAGCLYGPPCQISGSWVDSPSAVEEPGMLSLVLMGLAWLIGLRCLTPPR
jgi:hypothetical protein